MEQLLLSDHFKDLWRGSDPFAAVHRLKGKLYRDMKSRKTIRFALDGKTYFAKIHYGIGWSAVLKDLLQCKWPVLGARHEWMALNRLHEIGVNTLTPVAFGSRGWNPARRKSFIITEALHDTRSLEDICKDWPSCPPSFQWKRALVIHVAMIMRKMHHHGMNHRDCYICHFHVDQSSLLDRHIADDQHIYIIDLHRAQIRRRTPRRWLIKDVAGLYFSTMDIGLTKGDYYRFIREYEQKPLHIIFQRRKRFWKQVENKAVALYKKHASRVQGDA